MVKLLSTYDNYKLEHEKFYLLGHKVPHKLNELSNTEMSNLFLYTYSFLGLNILEFLPMNKLKDTLVLELDKLDKLDTKVSFNNKWWYLALVYLRTGSDTHNLRFTTSLCNTLMDNIHKLSDKELMLYCNTINDSLSEQIGFELRIRPSLDKNPNVYIYPIYRDLTLSSKKIISIFKRNLYLEEVNNEDINREFALISDIGYNYDKWSVIFDLLIGQILTHIDKPSFSTNHNETLANILDLSLLNLYIDTDFIPDNLSLVRNEIIKILDK